MLRCVLLGLLVALVLPGAARAQAAPLPPYPTCVRASGPETTCAHTIYSPTGPVQGVLLVIASGGWRSEPRLADGSNPATAAYSRPWRDLGFATVVVEITTSEVGARKLLGPRGVADAVRWYDALRARTTQNFGNVPLCTFGQSAGGHVALMVGVVRPGVSCIVTEGAPTDLNGLPPGSYARGLADRAFNPGDAALRARFSPASHDAAGGPLAGRPILMGHLRDDDLVPLRSQLTSFGTALPNVTRQVLEPGPPGCPPDPAVLPRFAHTCSDDTTTPGKQAGVTQASITEWRGREAALATSLTTPPAPPTAPVPTPAPPSTAAAFGPSRPAIGPAPVRAQVVRTTRRSVTLRLTSTESSALRGTARLQTRSRSRSPRSATARVTLAPGARARVTLRLGARARATLRRGRRLRLGLRLALEAGASRRTVVVPVSLRAQR